MLVSDAVVLSAAPTPNGKYGGSFKDAHPAELGPVAADQRGLGMALAIERIE
jgi:hypothetical protein